MKNVVEYWIDNNQLDLLFDDGTEMSILDIDSVIEKESEDLSFDMYGAQSLFVKNKCLYIKPHEVIQTDVDDFEIGKRLPDEYVESKDILETLNIEL